MVNRRTLLLGSVAAAIAGIPSKVTAAYVADWRRIASSGLPGTRWDHTLSAYAKRKELFLAFGRNDAGMALGDCWLADRSDGDWAPLDATGPTPRFGHAVATEVDSGMIYLFGGQQGDQFSNELWVLDLDGNHWELLSDGAPGPSPRYGTSLVHDGEGSLYVSHGFTFEGRFDDTWRFDLASGTWEDRSPAPELRPLKRCLHEAAWDGSSESMWLYGGCSSGFGPCPRGDLWRFNPGSGEWSEVPVSGPSGRSNPSLTIERTEDRLVMFGGLTTDGVANDLWIGTAEGGDVQWEAVSPSTDWPSARSSHDTVLSGGALYLFGGVDAEGALGDLWRLKILQDS
jgi:hypothetical protein